MVVVESKHCSDGVGSIGGGVESSGVMELKMKVVESKMK